MKMTISRPRRDGKFPVRFYYEGAPNMFGGQYPGKVLNKLFTRERIIQTLETVNDWDQVTNQSGVEFKCQ